MLSSCPCPRAVGLILLLCGLQGLVDLQIILELTSGFHFVLAYLQTQTAGGPTPVQRHWNDERHWRVLALKGMGRRNNSVNVVKRTLALGSKLPLISMEASSDFFSFSLLPLFFVGFCFCFFFSLHFWVIPVSYRLWGLHFSVHLDFRVELTRRNNYREENRAAECHS